MAEKASFRIYERIRRLEETMLAYRASDTVNIELAERLARQAEELAELQEFAEIARRLEALEQEVTRLRNQVEGALGKDQAR